MAMNKITFTTKLSSCIIVSEKLRYFIRKKIEVSIRESERKKKKKRNWECLGIVDHGGKFDEINIRDYSYE